jgi:type III pantothenate kinase
LRRLLCIGRLVPRKGVEDAIRATAELDGVELVVVGGPDAASLDADAEVRRLRALAAGAGVAGRVRFTGSIPHDRLAPVIRSADAVLCLPWYEPFGIVPLEAMACGVPVVATGVGGLLDTVEDGVTGLHVPPRDPGATALAVRALLEDESLRARLGRGGRERVRRYAWSQVAGDVEATYLRASLRAVGVRPREEVAG